MKKVLAILLALSVLALSACAAKQANSDTQKDSGTAETEQEPDSAQSAETQHHAQEAKRIEPLAESLDLNALTDATVAASFGAENISKKDGKMEITLTVYDYDVYDMVDVAQLAVGDTIVVDGKDMTKLSVKELRKARKDISMIFQSFNLLMQRTALDNICFPLELVGTPRAKAVARAKELLDLVGLGNRAGAYPAQLSGGQKQRVAIARALATDPKVLLCDEATSALDPTTTLSILDLLKELNQKLGVTVVVITHQMNVIEEICHRVAILDHGVVAEQDTVEEIFSNPKTDIGRQLVYPNGVRIDQLPPAQVIRVAFIGGSSYEPLIASLAIDCGVKVNILGADTRNMDGKAFGTMLLGLPKDPKEAGKALDYIKSQPDITVEEVSGHA